MHIQLFADEATACHLRGIFHAGTCMAIAWYIHVAVCGVLTDMRDIAISINQSYNKI